MGVTTGGAKSSLQQPASVWPGAKNGFIFLKIYMEPFLNFLSSLCHTRLLGSVPILGDVLPKGVLTFLNG